MGNSAGSFDWDKLKSLTPSRLDKPPENSISVYDFCAKMNCPLATAQTQLDSLLRRGQLQAGKFWNGERGRWIKYYWHTQSSETSPQSKA